MYLLPNYYEYHYYYYYYYYQYYYSLSKAVVKHPTQLCNRS